MTVYMGETKATGIRVFVSDPVEKPGLRCRMGFHDEVIVRDGDEVRYSTCRRCGRRRALQMVRVLTFNVDRRWVDTGKWSRW